MFRLFYHRLGWRNPYQGPFFQFNFLITRKHWCRWPDRWPIWQTTAWKLSRSLCIWHRLGYRPELGVEHGVYEGVDGGGEITQPERHLANPRRLPGVVVDHQDGSVLYLYFAIDGPDSFATSYIWSNRFQPCKGLTAGGATNSWDKMLMRKKRPKCKNKIHLIWGSWWRKAPNRWQRLRKPPQALGLPFLQTDFVKTESKHDHLNIIRMMC